MLNLKKAFLLLLISGYSLAWADCSPHAYSCKLPKTSKLSKSSTPSDYSKEPSRVLGAKSFISNGTLYVSKQKIDANSEDDMVVGRNAKGVVIIEGGNDINKIVVSDLHISARNIRSSTSKKDHAVLVINAPKNVDIEFHNSRVDGKNLKFSSMVRDQGVIGGINIDSADGSNGVDLKRLKVNLSSSYLFAEVDN